MKKIITIFILFTAFIACSFRTEGHVRGVAIDGVSNVRDLGGGYERRKNY